jgi:transposase
VHRGREHLSLQPRGHLTRRRCLPQGSTVPGLPRLWLTPNLSSTYSQEGCALWPKPFPAEFRRDVVAVARKHEAPLNQIAKDFGVSEATLHNWLKRADVEEGVREGTTSADQKELRESRKRIKLLEQENYILRRAAAYLGQQTLPK